MVGKVTSCGVLVLDKQGELLLGHATGSRHWDIPKGVADPGETPLQTAVRETWEEFGLRLDPAALLDLGVFRYLRRKDLYLYATLVDRFDLARCSCTSLYSDARGRMRPEVDAWEWTAFDQVPARCAGGMAHVLCRSLSLAAVMANAPHQPVT